MDFNKSRIRGDSTHRRRPRYMFENLVHTYYSRSVDVLNFAVKGGLNSLLCPRVVNSWPNVLLAVINHFLKSHFALNQEVQVK